MDKIRSVNLGGWFVLERWMDDELFSRNNVKGNDETCFSKQAPKFKEELNNHYKTFIKRSDIEWIKDHKVNLVRLPIPWWLFGEGVYHRSVEYIDKAVEMFEEVGIDYMLDLHTAPGCQNGFDNGGIQYVLEWPNDPKNIDKTIEILEEIAKRYKGNKHFHSIQLLNEPFVSVDIDLIKDFYKRSYDRLRKILPDTYIVMHDAFRLHEWEKFFTENNFSNVILDTHMYQCFDDYVKALDIDGHVKKALERKKILSDVEKYVPVIVGEWSLGLSPNKHITKDNMDEAMKKYASAQLEAMRDCAGHTFWAYRVKKSYSGWCFRDLVDRKIIDIEEFVK